MGKKIGLLIKENTIAVIAQDFGSKIGGKPGQHRSSFFAGKISPRSGPAKGVTGNKADLASNGEIVSGPQRNIAVIGKPGVVTSART